MIFEKNSLIDKSYDILVSHEEISDVCETIKKGFSPIYVSGVSSVHKSVLACVVQNYLDSDDATLIVCENEANARRICDDINMLAGGTYALVYPAKNITLLATEGVSREYEYQRLNVLYTLAMGRCKFVCTSIEALSQATIPKQFLLEKVITLKSGDIIETNSFSHLLVGMGYSRCAKVDGVSQFSIRGSIIDIFPVSESYPIRIELWGDEIDSITYFDVESQRRTDSADMIAIPPASEVLFESKEVFSDKIRSLCKGLRSKKADIIRNKLERDASKVDEGLTLYNIDKYISLAYEGQHYLVDYLPKDSVIMISEYRNCIETSKAVLKQHKDDIDMLYEMGELCKGLSGYIASFEEIMKRVHMSDSSRKLVLLDSFMRQVNEVGFKKLININAYGSSAWGGEMRQLSEDLHSYISKGYAVMLLAGSKKTLPIIANDLQESGIACDVLTENISLMSGRTLVTDGCLSGGFDFPSIKLAFITQAKAMVSKRKLKKKEKGSEILALSDIVSGDLVVHALHGIGKFVGIKKLELEGVTKDYITIQYAGTDVLYVPVTQLDLISRYIGPGGDNNIKLNKLSSNDWQKTRARVRKAVKDMAVELTALYAKRSQTKGFAFSCDDDLQSDFEMRFDYTETDDQLRSIYEIKTDMEKDIPMDRLLCGDVGVGKTEVAFRAACKCMLDGKQCALLCPTTVLAWQHYQSAIKRFEHFPVKIELLSRFRSRKEQLDVIKQLKAGTVDMVIGTHRLVQKDVEFKDLGLAIIDEEQRFGVAHKEKFKKAFTGVDVLMLSATPIPRTLNMAMSGIRDMSVIEEPPIDRYPVQTFVIEHDMGIITQAIAKELKRGGQVYYIHNRIDTIEQCAGNLRSLLPDARIAVAHGQIGEENLSDIWQQLLTRELDILVCTTIIETGVDVPNVNTLIIEDSDKMGLSQLYQLRGRVGRSNRRAYAYFTFKRDKVITEIAAQRLDAIREFTQFGSGFKIAMRDLEIRGAGNILGGQQHGHMDAVGYDMYIRMLNEALAEESGQPIPQKPEDCLIDLQIEAHIPPEYIEDLSGRLEAYRKIAAISTKEDSEDLIDEFIDRYGDPPKSILGLITVSLVRNMAMKVGITEITQRKGKLVIFIKSMDLMQLQALVAVYDDDIKVSSIENKTAIAITIKKGQSIVETMKKAVEVLHSTISG